MAAIAALREKCNLRMTVERYVSAETPETMCKERGKIRAMLYCTIPDMEIRKATSEDIPRIAEILVFSKRKNYRSIFSDDMGSFVDLQVYSLAKSYFDNPELLDGILVYDDQFVKALIFIDNHEIKELYVDPFFEGAGIGGKLLEYAVSKYHCKELWVLDKNNRAKKFYNRHGFAETGEVREVPEAPESGILECKMLRKD